MVVVKLVRFRHRNCQSKSAEEEIRESALAKANRIVQEELRNLGSSLQHLHRLIPSECQVMK
jgi:hypothetical protein